ICLAISPAMKKLGIKNRCRVFQIPAHVEYITAMPRMQKYIDYAADIYEVYLKYVSKEDIYVYSIDEVFMDVTDYLNMYQMTARELADVMMADVLKTTGIPASCGIGTNMYLAKIALDITAKHAKDNIGYLDEKLFCGTLWKHRPLTDFWRIGPGTAKRLAGIGILTMEDIAHADEELLYRTFGVDAELMIDHAWGRETVKISDVKNYRPSSKSLSSGQVLSCDYSFEDAKLIVKEMTDLLCLDLVDKGLITESMTLVVGYSNELHEKMARGTASMSVATNSAKKIIPYMMDLFDQIVDKNLPVRRINMSFQKLTDEVYEQYDLFTDSAEIERERRLQKATLSIKKKFGKNAILKGMNLQEAGTTIERNQQIGGHRSGDETC
ncbi:MAG: DNA repair protein, partial [Agathobacter sp.]|nr:DNA repair protein [Agathobacter sp.]